MSDALQYIQPIKSDKVTTSDLCMALLSDMGCRSSSMPKKLEGNVDYSGKWEFFNPFKVTSLDEYRDLPEHWQSIFRNQNRECWNCKYTYLHSPDDIIGSYPRIPAKGIFVITNGETDSNKIQPSNLLHTAGQFIESDTKDKGIWMSWIESNAEEENS